MFVKYVPKHPHVKVVPIVNNDGLSVAAESVVLNPGTNEISDEKWNKIKGSLASEIEDGIVKPFSVKTEDGGKTSKAKTLKDVPVSTAAMIVAACSNKDTLRAWFKDRLPDEIALLVVRRMRQLNMDIDEISGDDDSLSSDDEFIDESGSEAGSKKDGGEKGDEDKKQTGKQSGGKNGKSGTTPKADGDKGGDDDIPDFDNPEVTVK